MRRYVFIVLAAVGSGCSFLVHFDQQPCDQASECLPGSVCTDAGVCIDAGVQAPQDAGSNCTARETACGDGNDNDCDGLKDCADSDCGGVSCDDRDPCTTGEKCSGGSCATGTAVVCNTPPNSSCQQTNGRCEPGTGRCLYTSLSDGTGCGTGVSSRCCAGACVNTASNVTNCGGCGIVCTTGQLCQGIEMSSCAVGEPSNTSGRCGCGTGIGCPSFGPDGGNAQTCGLNGRCAPTTATQCAPGQMLGDAGVCANYCRY